MRTSGADDLAYALLDAIIDGFYPVLEVLGDKLDGVELDALAGLEKHGAPYSRHQAGFIATTSGNWPQRELANSLMRDGSPHIQDNTRLYLRDTYDHALQVMDMVETFREIASGLMDVYLSGVSNRMNEIMKVLTIISTIFLPLTFIAGVYGMNFDTSVSPYNMPEFRLAIRISGVDRLYGVQRWRTIRIYWRKGWVGKERDGISVVQEELLWWRYRRCKWLSNRPPERQIGGGIRNGNLPGYHHNPIFEGHLES